MKKLYKSNNRMICGVCAGIAEYLGIDPTEELLAIMTAEKCKMMDRIHCIKEEL